MGSLFQRSSLSTRLFLGLLSSTPRLSLSRPIPSTPIWLGPTFPDRREVSLLSFGLTPFNERLLTFCYLYNVGLGPDLKLPLFADRNLKVSRDYGVLLEDEGIALRGLFLIDPKGTLRQSVYTSPCHPMSFGLTLFAFPLRITINDLAVGRSVEETIRLVKAFQFTDEVCLFSRFVPS